VQTGDVHIVEPQFFEMSDLGYAIKDINNDGTLELILLTWGHREYAPAGEPFILTLFTLIEDKPMTRCLKNTPTHQTPCALFSSPSSNNRS